MRSIFLTIALSFLTNSLISQSSIEWQKALGGSDLDEAYSIQQTTDGGYIIAGKSNSTDGDVSDNNGSMDFWIVRLDPMGEIIWEKSLLDDGFEVAYAIQQTNDGGFIVAGSSDNDDGVNMLVIKLKDNGDVEWQTYLGGSGFDAAYSVRQTTGGEYIVAGESNSEDGDVTAPKGAFDAWIVKLDPFGEIMWERSFGGTQDDRANAIQLTSDGGMVFAGHTFSSDGDITGHHGLNDFWIVKLDSLGTLEWQKALGGQLLEEAMTLYPAADGGIIAAGYTFSFDGDVTVSYGNQDIWVVKLNSQGDLHWQKTLGGSENDILFSIDQPALNEFKLAGGTNSTDFDVSSPLGAWDYWVISLDNAGNLTGEESFGGSSFDVAYSIEKTADNGYVIAGYSDSSDGQVTGSHGGRDYWIVKISPAVRVSETTDPIEVLVYPAMASTTLYFDVPFSFFDVEFINEYGVLVDYRSGLHSTPLDIAQLPAGFYFIRISWQYGSVVRKIIKG